jgi:RNA polymerase sigma-70 factor, ECF subfamily
VDGARAEPVTRVEPDDRVAFECLYREYFEAMYAYVMRRAAIADTADLVADVFATAWRRMTDVPDPPEDKLWLFGVARRVVSQYHRGTARQQRLTLKLRRNGAPAVADRPGDTSELEQRALRLVDGLKPIDRELVTLIVWDGLSRAEVATVLGCSANAVGIRWHRVLKRLRRGLAGAAELKTDHSTVALAQPVTEET